MIIEDLKGKKYEISKTRIRELPLVALSRYVLFSELRASLSEKSRDTPVRYRGESTEPEPNYLMDLGPTNLGCREFSPEVFAKILKAAGVRKTKRKPVKKARRA